jgi:glycosyltransferase involved in cell wall biosynthesis
LQTKSHDRLRLALQVPVKSFWAFQVGVFSNISGSQRRSTEDLKIQRKGRLLVYDTDGGNPYGRELAALLCHAFQVEVLASADAEWSPPQVVTRRVLPSNSRSSKIYQIIRQLHGLAVAARAAAAGATILLVMTRGSYDQLAFALMAMLGARVVVVAHDPTPKQALSPIDAFSRRQLWQRASALVAHSETLAEEAAAASSRSAAVVPHLPFLEYAAWAKSAVPASEPAPRHRLLILGRMRPDKGLDRIPDILGHLQADDREHISVAFAGIGDCSEIVDRLGSLAEVVRRPSPYRLSDFEIATALAESDVLIAPYPLVSASGTVVLALSRGLRVVAYDTGALSDVVAPDGLVTPGDEEEFANRIMTAFRSGCGGPVQALAMWKEQSFNSWMQCLNALERHEGQSAQVQLVRTR